ncbi:MAG: hypothetical protein ACI4JN_08360 [Ruminococcus sp.]
MKIFRKLFAAFTAAFITAAIAVPCFSASAAEKSLTAANNAPYTVLMGLKSDCVNNQDGELWDQKGSNFQTISADGDYKVSYTIEKNQGSGKNIYTLALDTNMKKDSLPGVAITVNSISLIKASDGTIVSIPYNGASAVQTVNTNGCHRLNILYSYGTTPAKAIDSVMPDFAKGDELAVTFNISGLAPAVSTEFTPDTTTADTSSGGSFGGMTSFTTTVTGASIGGAGNTNSSVGTVAQTADPGVVAVVVTGGAAAALALGAFTIRRKKK